MSRKADQRRSEWTQMAVCGERRWVDSAQGTAVPSSLIVRSLPPAPRLPRSRGRRAPDRTCRSHCAPDMHSSTSAAAAPPLPVPSRAPSCVAKRPELVAGRYRQGAGLGTHLFSS
eukprot:scaffold3575_cov254-Pinguiococcus_pyrenoidosus.AAC.2